MNIESFLQLADVLPEAMFLVDDEGRILACNAAAGVVLRMQCREVAGSKIGGLLAKSQEEVARYLSRCLRSRALLPGRLAWRASDGELIDCHCLGALIQPRSARSPAQLLLRCQNKKNTFSPFKQVNERIAELHLQMAAAKEGAETANRIKSTSLATVSHELRTPLNAILGFTGIILQGMAGPLNAEQSKQLEMVRSSARHLLSLINDVLDISKVDAGELKVSCEPFDLSASIAKVAGFMRPLAEKKGVLLRVEVASGPCQAVSDQRCVEQILLNLLSNGIKFTDHGDVCLTAEVVPNFRSPDGTSWPAVHLRVSDTGKGIKAEDLSTIFQPFRQIDDRLSREHEGTGLGLAISRRLADLLGGEIRAESEWEKGSVFTFMLPLNRKEQRRSEPVPPAQRATGGNGYVENPSTHDLQE